MPDFTLENEYDSIVIGVDEVGRGPLAGPVVAAAVYIPPENRNHPVWKDVQDSKKLSAIRRDILFSVIKGQCVFGIAEASVTEIDELNILQATFLAMRRSIEQMKLNNPYILIDGNRLPKNWPWDSRAIIKGDSKSVSIAAASILAKVTRDKMMEDLSKTHPFYGWDNNAGYGTPEHLAALTTHGITPHHRQSFAPVRLLKSA
jgi:ribonuclease HII